jgi:hypothetical protein
MIRVWLLHKRLVSRLATWTLVVRLSLLHASVGHCEAGPTRAQTDSDGGPTDAAVGVVGSGSADLLTDISWEPLSKPEATSRNKTTIATSLAAEEAARWNIGGNGDPSYLSSRSGYHPGTRVVVEIQPLGHSRTSRESTTLRRYQVVFRNLGYWPYRICFESFAEITPNRGGETWIQVRTSGQGRVIGTRLLGSNLAQAEMAACLFKATRSITFDRQNLPRAAFALRVRVFPGDAQLPPVVRDDRLHTIDFSANPVAFGLIREPVELCIREGRKHDARLWGRLALSLRVDEQGRVVSASQYGSHFPDSTTVTCSTSAMLRLQLPGIAGPGALRVAARVGKLPQSMSEKPQNVETGLQE